ncbi:MAG: M48 family metalloprotease [Acidobacteriia bacterium]|nr:M48 family metalloprotease [Terriglobia bacterium]
MRTIWKHTVILIGIAFLVAPALAQVHQFKPGFNLFSKDQDVQLGKEAAGEIEKQVEVINDRELNAYISSIGSKLAAQPQADKYPYTFKVVNDKSINAFALPGGPAFVHTGLIAAVDNEAQLAGVLAHEISHVALRHGTNQASKANLMQLPALLASKAAGSGSMLGQLSQIGIGLGANSVLLKFSRTAENQADLVGAQIAAQAGYNPVEIARFFQKLEAEGGSRGPQFFSDHPNPANRMKAIEDEIRQMPQRNFNADTGQLARMKAIVAKLPPPKKTPAQSGTSTQGGASTQTGPSTPSGGSTELSIPNSRPSGRTQQYQGKDFSLSYPSNWKTFASQDASGVTIAAPSGMQQSQGGVSVGYGTVLAYYRPKDTNASLWQATDEFVSQLRSSDPRMRAGREMPREIKIGGKNAIVTTLYSDSIFQGQTEADRLVTIPHPNGMLYLVFVAPDSERPYADGAFDQMIQSIRFRF